MRPPMGRSRRGALALAATVALTVGAVAPATAGETIETWMPATTTGIDCQTNPENPRSWIAKVYGRFRDVPGITHATLFYLLKDDDRSTGRYPPFHDDQVQSYFHHVAPVGFHDLQIRGLAGTLSNLAPEGCPWERLEPWAAEVEAVRVRVRTDQPVASCGGRVAQVVGGPGPDLLRTSDHPSLASPIVMHGLGGADTIIGDTDVRTIQCGGAGKDTLRGGPKGDRLFGQRGQDTVAGRGGGSDRCDGGPGRDVRGRGCEFVTSIP